MKLVNFKEAFFKARLLYGIEENIEELEELGMIAWDKINMKYSKLYRYLASVDGSDYSIELPCNCDQIEAVTLCHEDYKLSDTYFYGDINSAITEQYIEFRKRNLPPLYSSGEFVPYEQVDNMLYFTAPYSKVQILYKGYLADEEGLPLITDKQAEAIAAYIAYSIEFKRGYVTRDSNSITWAVHLDNKWRSLCAAARVSDYLSQNEMDQILEAKSSWGRKTYHKSYKPIN